MTSETALPEHSLGRLTRQVGDFPAGTVGTIVHVYPGGLGYEVEFNLFRYTGEPEGNWQERVVTVDAEDLEGVGIQGMVKMMWRGQNIDDMTREQAIEALRVCVKILYGDTENKNIDPALDLLDTQQAIEALKVCAKILFDTRKGQLMANEAIRKG